MAAMATGAVSLPETHSPFPGTLGGAGSGAPSGWPCHQYPDWTPCTASAGTREDTTTPAATTMATTVAMRAVCFIVRSLGSEEVGYWGPTLEDVVHALLNHRGHLGVGEDVEAFLADRVEHLARHFRRLESRLQKTVQDLTAHVHHRGVLFGVLEVGGPVAVGLVDPSVDPAGTQHRHLHRRAMQRQLGGERLREGEDVVLAYVVGPHHRRRREPCHRRGVHHVALALFDEAGDEG